MARGYPDYTSSSGRTQEGVFLPLLSLPPVWFIDTFDTPTLLWDSEVNTIRIVTQANWTGTILLPYSGYSMLYLYTDAGGNFEIDKSIGICPLTANIGISINFNIVDRSLWKDATNSLQVIGADYYTGTLTFSICVHYNPQDYKWYYLNSDGSTRTYLFTLKIDDSAWHYVKLIIDPVNNKYISLQIDSYIYIFSDVSYYSTTSTNEALFYIYVEGFAATATNAVFLIDNITLTYGES